MASEEPEILKPGVSIKPHVTERDVTSILNEVYGLRCLTLKELNGYDDKNYYVKVESVGDNPHIEDVCDKGYVLKFINSLDSKKTELFDAQTAILLHLRGKGFCCPNPVKTKSGVYYIVSSLKSGKHLVRLLEFIDATILYQLENPSLDLFYQCGQYVAELDESLKDFQHTAYDTHKTLWMFDSVPQLIQFLFAVQDDSKQHLVKDVVKEFESRVLPQSKNFSKAIIHGDFNEQNILVEQTNTGSWKVKGILDFGDTQLGCHLYELAVAMAYAMFHGNNVGSLEVGGHFLAGYTAVIDVPDDQLALLKVCIAARLCQSLVLGAYFSSQDPTNTYLLTTAKTGWSLLEELWSQPEDQLLERWLTISESRKAQTKINSIVV